MLDQLLLSALRTPHSVPIADSSVVGWTAIAITCLFGLLTIWTAFVLAGVQRSQKLQDDERVANAAKVAQVEMRLAQAEHQTHEVIEKLVDARFREVTHQVNGVANSFALATEDIKRNMENAIGNIKERLEDGDGQLSALQLSDHKIELQVLGKFEQYRDWMRDTFAGKQDLKDHEKSMTTKVEKLNEHLNAVQTAVEVAKATTGKQKP